MPWSMDEENAIRCACGAYVIAGDEYRFDEHNYCADCLTALKESIAETDRLNAEYERETANV
jgi:hypothetical protein